MRIRINYCRATDVCGAGSSPLRGEGFESSADFDLYKKHHQLSLHTQPKPIQNTSKKCINCASVSVIASYSVRKT
ncbi:MAG: hypothetical protein ACK55Z_14660 [bacterium]